MWDKTNGQYIKKGMDAMNSFDPNGHARKKETKLTNNSIQNRRVCVCVFVYNNRIYDDSIKQNVTIIIIIIKCERVSNVIDFT